MNKREEIPKLAKELVFLSNDRRQYLLNNYKKISDEKIAKFYDFLVAAIKKQNEIVEEEIRKDPNLVYKNKSKIVKDYLNKIHNKEKELQINEELKLLNLERELAQI